MLLARQQTTIESPAFACLFVVADVKISVCSLGWFALSLSQAQDINIYTYIHRLINSISNSFGIEEPYVKRK